jgi:hypothetical protein
MMLGRWLAFFALGVSLASPALAQEEPPKAAQKKEAKVAKKQEDPPPESPISKDDERAVPDYDGRGDDPTTAGDVLIWVPRVIFSPLYFVSEFIIRRPLGWLVSTAEAEEIPQKVLDLLTFGPDNNIGIFPTGLFDFGFRPSVGLYFFWDDFIAKDNHLRARVATGGSDWFLLTLADRIVLDPDHELTFRAEYGFRPDWIFHGLGPESGPDSARFKATKTEVGFRYDAKLWRSSELTAFAAVRDVTFDASTGAFEEPTVADEVQNGRFPAPPGIEDGYTVLRTGIEADLDTRKIRKPEQLPDASDWVSPPGSGVRLQLRGEHASGLRQIEPLVASAPRYYDWVKYGATLGGFLDVTGDQRVIGLSFVADFADPLDENGTIPFTEQASLGGVRPMRGYLEGRLVDRSDAVGLLTYQWPIWVWLDGGMHYAVGNVFGEHLDGFELGKLRQSFGLGLRSSGNPDHALEVLLAFGTDTFDRGAEVEAFRFVLGATSGF